MTKLDFILKLHEQLAALPQNEVEDRLTFYTEMIEERMEEGISEEDAVAAVGTVEEIAEQIVREIAPAVKKTPAAPKQKKRKTWEIVLLILGSPIWLSLLIAAFAVLISLYAALWSVIVSLWAAFGSVAGCAFGGIVGGVFVAISGYIPAGIALISGGLVCAGLAIFLFYGCKYATIGAAWLTKLPFRKLFAKKEEVL